jgi:hypothetical protein
MVGTHGIRPDIMRMFSIAINLKPRRSIPIENLCVLRASVVLKP